MSDYKLDFDIQDNSINVKLGFFYSMFRYMAVEILMSEDRKNLNLTDRLTKSEIVKAINYLKEHKEAVSLGIDKVVYLVYLFYLKEKFDKEFNDARKIGKDFEYWFINVSIRDIKKFKQPGMTEQKILEDFYLEKNLAFNNIAWEFSIYNTKTQKSSFVDPRYSKSKNCFDNEKQTYKYNTFARCSTVVKRLIKSYENIIAVIRKDLNTRSKFHLYETALSAQRNKLYSMLTKTDLKDSSEVTDLYEDAEQNEE